MPLPPCDGDHFTLPYRDEPYAATLDEIEHHFVNQAPASTQAQRAFIMRALRLHCDLVQRFAARHDFPVRTHLNGGFTTWKRQNPKDVDLVVFVPLEQYPRLFTPRGLSLWTLSEVSATLGGEGGPTVEAAAVVQPGFSLVDAYINPDLGPRRREWHDKWSAVRDPETKRIIPEGRKGYIEVVNE